MGKRVAIMKTKINYNNPRIDTVNANIFDTIDSIFNHSPASINIFIPNVCPINNDGISSFSRELYRRFPIVEASLNVTANKKPGRVCFVDVKTNPKNKSKIIVSNMFCQISVPKPKRSLHYGQLVFCMYEIKQKLIELQKNNPDFVSEIHSPKFGVGITGGNWNFISDLVIDIWGDFRVVAYNHLVERDK
jgi:hypothetical protein